MNLLKLQANTRMTPTAERIENPNGLLAEAAGLDAAELYHGRILLADGKVESLPVAERFRLVRARIERQNLSGKNFRIIAVTSSVPEEGKSVTSVNMARAFSTNPTGKVLLIDCDLRKPSVHRFFGLRVGPGLGDALTTSTPLSLFTHPVQRGLDVISAGEAIEDPVRLLESPFFQKSLEELRNYYSYIILDCPPVLLCPEPVQLSSVADGTLMVVRGWSTEKRLVKDAVDILERDKLIGVVINDGTDSSRQYRYYRYYGYADSLQKRRREFFATRAKRVVSSEE